MDYPNQTAERQARDQIGKKLIQAGRVIQDKKHSKQKIYNTGRSFG